MFLVLLCYKEREKGIYGKYGQWKYYQLQGSLGKICFLGTVTCYIFFVMFLQKLNSHVVAHSVQSII